MKRFIVPIATLVLAAGCASAPPKAAPEPPWKVQVQSLPVRAQPEALSPRIGTLDYKQEVTVMATNGPWIKVRTEGWVHNTGLTQRPLDASAGILKEFETATADVLKYLTNGVNNTK